MYRNAFVRIRIRTVHVRVRAVMYEAARERYDIVRRCANGFPNISGGLTAIGAVSSLTSYYCYYCSVFTVSSLWNNYVWSQTCEFVGECFEID